MGVDLTVGDKVYVHGKGRVMTVEDILIPVGLGPDSKHLTSINWADARNAFVLLKLTDSLTTDNLTVAGNQVSMW